MGYYIQTEGHRDKAAAVVREYNGQHVSKSEAEVAMSDPTKGVIVVLHNPLFEAAGFAYDMDEFKAFTESRDLRRKEFVVIARADAEAASGFVR